MTRRYIVALVIPAMLMTLVVIAPIASAQETTVPEGTETTVGEEGTETTVAGEEGGAETTAPTETIQPAVVDEPLPAPPEDVPWTYRYLIPLLLVLGGLVVVVTIIQYFVRVVRARYRPVP